MSKSSAVPVLPVGLTPADPARSEITEADRSALDEAIADLSDGAAAWAATSLAKRAELLGAVHASIAIQARRWALTARDIKGLDADSPLVGEEWSTGPYPVLLAASSLAVTVAGLAAGRSPLADARFGTAPGDRLTVPVLPHNPYEALLMHGFHAEVWLKPGVTADQARRTAGLAELTPPVSGGVGLVLGAGNITSIPPLDVLYEIVAHNRAVLLKLNPILQSMMSVYQSALRPLVDADLLRIVQGGAAVGHFLAHHDGIAHVHLTGSAVTHDVIVYGPGAEGSKRKAAGTPLLKKEISSELGGVSPVIIVPGAWTRRDLRYQAEHVVTQRLHNGSYNCIAAQVVLLSAEWPQKRAFLAELRAAMTRAPRRSAWYPGSDNRIGAAVSAYPRAERLAGGTRMLIDIPLDEDASVLERTEFFAPVLGVIELPGTGQVFLDSAIDTVNRDFFGTLGANVLIDPSQIKKLGAGFRNAIAKLRYGTIAINSWTGIGFITATATWGAFPGNTIDDVGSGIGIVHNALLIESAERTVVTGPFRPFPRSIAHGEFALFPKPPWFVTARSAQRTGRLLAEFAAKPGWLKLPAVFGSAFKA